MPQPRCDLGIPNANGGDLPGRSRGWLVALPARWPSERMPDRAYATMRSRTASPCANEHHVLTGAVVPIFAV